MIDMLVVLYGESDVTRYAAEVFCRSDELDRKVYSTAPLIGKHTLVSKITRRRFNNINDANVLIDDAVWLGGQNVDILLTAFLEAKNTVFYLCRANKEESQDRKLPFYELVEYIGNCERRSKATYVALRDRGNGERRLCVLMELNKDRRRQKSMPEDDRKKSFGPPRRIFDFG